MTGLIFDDIFINCILILRASQPSAISVSIAHNTTNISPNSCAFIFTCSSRDDDGNRSSVLHRLVVPSTKLVVPQLTATCKCHLTSANFCCICWRYICEISILHSEDSRLINPHLIIYYKSWICLTHQRHIWARVATACPIYIIFITYNIPP